MMGKTLVLFPLVLLTLAMSVTATEDDSRQRRKMVVEISEMVRYTSEYTGRTTLNRRIMEVMRKVPRHEFVPAAMRAFAYLNQPLPIGHGQTISQPYIVALMTDLADVTRDSIVLEVGTGSGYQAAVLAALVQHVYSIEIIDALGQLAGRTLSRLGYHNVTVKIGDGYLGWVEHAPYDAILITAASPNIPPALLAQLKSGGKLIMPLGKQSGFQTLQVVEKDALGKVTHHSVLPVGFVPLIHNQ